MAPGGSGPRLARQREVKGLGDVVARARLQPLDLVLPVVARREYQDRESLARGPQAADHLEAWQIREPEVDDGHVERIFESGKQPLVAVARHIHREARGGEALLQPIAQRRLLLDP